MVLKNDVNVIKILPFFIHVMILKIKCLSFGFYILKKGFQCDNFCLACHIIIHKTPSYTSYLFDKYLELRRLKV